MAPQIGSAESVDAADLAIERRLSGLDVRIPDEICELVAPRGEGEVRRAAGRYVGGVTAVDANAISDDEPLVVEGERTDQRDPEE